MIADMRHALENVIRDTFETMVFMFPDDRDQPPPPEEACRTAVVEFAGPLCGELRLSVSPEMPGPLAANMLGLEEGRSPSPEHELDALRELLNVICGNLLPLISSPREVFNVQEPYILADPCDRLDDVTACSAMWLDGGFVRVSLKLRNVCVPDLQTSRGEAGT
jgi:hypothetical protein